MAYSERIKRFDLIRDYMRDFLIFGFRTREEFRQKSGRTYDNERRRIESWLGENLRWEYRPGGKAVFLSLDASELHRNPLYRAWQSKSFTDNDITLHFLLLDLLTDGFPRHAEEVADALTERYAQVFDPQTVRRKLKEYESLGLFIAEKQGRRLRYALSPCTMEALFPEPSHLPELLAFFGEQAPFSVVGSFLSDRIGAEDLRLRFKHHFIAETLEDQILLAAVEAMRTGGRLTLTNVSGRNGQWTVCIVVPVRILVSVQSGRRYLAAWRQDQRRFATFRLDYIKALTPLEGEAQDAALRAQALERLAHAWGPSLPSGSRLEHIAMTITADEKREAYLIQRLHREGRGGRVEQTAPGRWRYTNEVCDTNEMMNWIKTFTGRIVSLEGDNQKAIDRFYRDMRRMVGMYGDEG